MSDFNPSEIEEKVLEFWEKNRIFQKSLDKTKSGKPYTFYDGPPFATGLPHYGHILASTIKDLIPRYQTMRGRFVRRRWGWDCHGLPIEEIVERQLKISGKKQIEEVGIEKFNRTCREAVLRFADEWGKMVRRIARWIDFDTSYKTMDRDYMESVWWAFKQIYDKGLVYEGRKVLMYCPRCETPVSNFEVAMDNSYKDVEEETVVAKFRVKPGQKIGGLAVPENTYFLAWTTTPWTLPGNVALAVGENIDYVKFTLPASESPDAVYLASIDFYAKHFSLTDKKVVLDPTFHDAQLGKKHKGKDLIGLEYEPLFGVPAVQSDKTFKVYSADFVSTEEGTGIVHTAVVYGEEDYALGMRVGLPVVPLLDGKGIFNDKAPDFLRGQYFEDANALVLNDLEKRGLVFRKEKQIHSYPHCWRCGNKLFYNAIPSWFINVQKIKKDLLAANDKEMNWYPEHLKHGRYEKSVESAPDWNISRNRYWGNPIPVWKCAKEDCPPIVIGSIKELGLSSNTFYFSRHAEAEQNRLNICSTSLENDKYDLTPEGVEEAKKMAAELRAEGGLDMIFASPFKRTKRTAEIVGQELGVPVATDERLREYNTGIFDGKTEEEFHAAFPTEADLWTKTPEGGENWTQIQERMLDFIRETDKKYQSKRILVVSHGDPLWLVQKHYGSELDYPAFARPFEISVGIADLHRPYIDEVVLKCEKCGGEARRVPEIFDSWVEAGSMPFAEYHYPFEQKDVFESRFPGQFVAEYIAQTRAWFYTMHVVSQILFDRAPVENLVTTGTILAEDGSKMSKSKNNYPDPWAVIEKYGVDALRFYLMNSAVMQADNLNFSERELQNVYRKVVLILWNVFNYYQTYSQQAGYVPSAGGLKSKPAGALDKWIFARTQELVNQVTQQMDAYDTVRASRAMAAYVDDLSTWYLRRCRGRMDAEFFTVLRHSLLNAAKSMAPLTPYISEEIYRGLNIEQEIPSVHLADWPESRSLSAEEEKLVRDMAVVREAASVGQSLRKTLNIPVRQPLPRLAFFTGKDFEPSGELMGILLAELNVKRFDPALSSEKSESVKTATGTEHILNFYLDVSLSDELRLEGLVRGLERAVQEMRKKQGLKVGEMATLLYSTEDAELKKGLELFDRKKTYISTAKESAAGEAVAIDGKSISLGLEKN